MDSADEGFFSSFVVVVVVVVVVATAPASAKRKSFGFSSISPLEDWKKETFLLNLTRASLFVS